MTTPPTDYSNYDMRAHDDTWRKFNFMAKWTIILVVILLAGMALFLTGGHPPKPV